MKRIKAILAIVLVLSLFVTLFAACAKTETPAKSDAPASESKTDTPAPAADDGGAEDEETAEIVFYFYDMRDTGGEFGQEIEDAVNELIVPKINVKVDITWVNFGDWTNKTLLALSSGERMDIIHLSPVAKVNKLTSLNQLMPIQDLAPTYAPEALEKTADYLGTYTYGGNLYGLPTIRNYCRNMYILMNKGMLEEMGMLEFAENIKSWSEFEEVMQAVKENYTDKDGSIYPIGKSTSTDSCYFVDDTFASVVNFDTLGSPASVVISDNDGHVDFYQASDAYKSMVEKNQLWWDKGWQWPESEFDSGFVDDSMKAGVIFSNVCGSEYGVAATKSAAYGYDVIAVQTVVGMVKTEQPIFTGVGIPVNAEEPEAALKFINELYTNPDLLTLLIWGREGKEHTVVDGEVVSAEGNHYWEVDFLLGDSTMLTPCAGNGADFYEKVREINATCDKSPYLGFAFDTAELDLLIGQITAVTDQYSESILYGNYTEEYLNNYIAKLEEAGVHDYLDELQKQLSAWLAAK